MSVLIHDVLEGLRETALDERDKGDKFEALVLNLLRTEPEGPTLKGPIPERAHPDRRSLSVGVSRFSDLPQPWRSIAHSHSEMRMLVQGDWGQDVIRSGRYDNHFV